MFEDKPTMEPKLLSTGFAGGISFLFLAGCLSPGGIDSPDTAGEGSQRSDTAELLDTATDPLWDLDPSTLPQGATPCRDPVLVQVTTVVDGDTVWVVPYDLKSSEKVRFIGVDTPEESTDDCYSDEATFHTGQRLLGQWAWLTFDADCLDYYDRTLAYVHTGNSVSTDFFNRDLLLEGYARVLTVEPNSSFASLFTQDEDEARAAMVGGWQYCGWN